MAPPIPVFSANEIHHRYDEQMQNPEKFQCHLKSLTQHECTFRPSTPQRSTPEFICLPFKRIFRRCLVPTLTKRSNGEKVKGEKWINIEVTDAQTNADLLDRDSKYSKYVQEFLTAEKELKELIEESERF
ncbi:uncharacterized protein LODBEIA_P13900 [Lodderomyces beijingensis]|uniref:Uncharacterized protein n=1 Tax=Lodderomyces beijingensis TaxID=1775926 RepID=A0ABP0ZG60_9ASCO